MVYDLHFEAVAGLAHSLLPHLCELKGIGLIVTLERLPLFSLSFVDVTICVCFWVSFSQVALLNLGNLLVSNRHLLMKEMENVKTLIASSWQLLTRDEIPIFYSILLKYLR